MRGGALDGTRVLSSEAIERATRVQNRRRDQVLFFRMHWRLGYHPALTLRGGLRGSFGHFGFGGSGAFTDPKRDLAVALVVNSGVGTPVGDSRILRITTAAVRAVDERRGRRAAA